MTVASLPHQDLYYGKGKRLAPQVYTVTPEWLEQVLPQVGVDRVDLFSRLDRGEVIETAKAYYAKSPALLLTQGGQ